jgi:TnpA family transposase
MPSSSLPADVLRAYGRFDGEPDAVQLATAFHLTDADHEILATQVTPANRLGLALQLCCVRFLGTFVADLSTVPPGVVAHVTAQVGVSGPSALVGYGRGGTTTRHRALIRLHDGYREPHEPAVALNLLRWLTERAWVADERPEALFELAVARLLSPRLRDIADQRYWRMDRTANYGRLEAVVRQVVRPERIERHWEDLLRIAGSLKLGTVRASDLMRTLQSGGRVSRLRQAIAELGRIVKTLYLLA